ncbi:MAG TPA: hypothetical protein VLK65_01775 [Vicinamibacteria bacterium]|nr:hypothetical protein [Vicinamibacteria bacterium]
MSIVADVLGYSRAEPRNTHLSRTTVLVIVPGYDTCEIQQADEKVKSSLRERSEPGALAAP